MPTSPLVILGIDPGSRITGYGLISSQGQKSEYIDSGCIKVAELPWAERLQKIFIALQSIVQEYLPDEGAIEQVFMHQNPGAALKLGQARGAAMVAASSLGVSMAEYSARQVKQSVVGYGAADKNQVQLMIKTLLKLNQVPQSDAADALAIAMCHAHSRSGIAELQKISGRRQGRVR